MSINSGASVMQVLLLQVQFDLAQAVADVTAAAQISARAQSEHESASIRCDEVAAHLRQVATRSRIDPAMLEGIRRIYRSEAALLNGASIRWEAAVDHENRARAVVTDLRNQERTYKEALRRHKSEQRRARQAADVVRADELWLQRYRAEP